jgi:hypothetical protein
VRASINSSKLGYQNDLEFIAKTGGGKEQKVTLVPTVIGCA